MKPEPGYYRRLLKDTMPEVRIARTDAPMTGVRVIPKDPIINQLEKSEDLHAQYYINGLKDGSLAAIVENGVSDKYWSAGELYLRS